MEIKYVIVEKGDVDSINFNEVIETAKPTLRYSLDGNQIILKFTGSTPAFLEGEVVYSHKEILEIINNPANGWVEN